uniref:Methyltransferase type 11 domain-containing protein n=1 Tax=Aegilops tauschii subsp. strangulata TaxID=200361 RepID=A0A453RL88_AEGTS
HQRTGIASHCANHSQSPHWTPPALPTPRIRNPPRSNEFPLPCRPAGARGHHRPSIEASARPRPDPSGGMTGAASQAYGEAWYWDERYRKEPGPFDWYQKYPALAPLLRLYVRPHQRLLLVGCGNSVFGENMVQDGYQDVVNIDISSVVIEQMKKKYHDKPQLKDTKMDVRNMSDFESGSFDAVIDKGTLDSIMVSQLLPGYSDILPMPYSEPCFLYCSAAKIHKSMQRRC